MGHTGSPSKEDLMSVLVVNLKHTQRGQRSSEHPAERLWRHLAEYTPGNPAYPGSRAGANLQP